jgi:hypothetical protein
MKLWNMCDHPLAWTVRDTSWLPSATQAKVMHDTNEEASACVASSRKVLKAATAPPSECPAKVNRITKKQNRRECRVLQTLRAMLKLI